LRQGKSIADTATLINDSMVLSKVANISSADATTYLTSAMKGYNIAVSDTLGIVDKLTSVDLVSASSAGGLAAGMSEVANSASLAGVSIDKLLGYLASIKEVTQASDETVGHAISSMFARMGNIKLARLKDYQNNGEDLSNTETILRGLGIQLRDSNKEFRNFGDVLDDVAAKWSTYSSVNQRAIAVAFASKTNMEYFLTLMNNYSKATEYATVASEANGTAMQKMATYTESIEAKQKKLTAATEGFSNALINSELIKFSYDSGTGILGFLTTLTDKLGALPVLATAAAAALSFKNQGSSIEYAPSCPMGRMAKTRIWCVSTAT
jgi:TP901 family phage tail tape measure protein